MDLFNFSSMDQDHRENPRNLIGLTCLPTHYENTTIQIYRKFQLQILKIFI